MTLTEFMYKYDCDSTNQAQKLLERDDFVEHIGMTLTEAKELHLIARTHSLKTLRKYVKQGCEL